MAIFDDKWLEWLQTAATALGTVIVGSVAWALATRRRLAKDNSDIAREKAETKVQNSLLLAVQAERDAVVERLEEINEEREKRFGACEERVRSLSEQVLDLRLANGRLLQELAALGHKEAAERLLVAQIRPGPPGKGDEPP